MPPSADQIAQEMLALENQVATLAHDFQALYTQYLDELGRIVYQQIVATGYHLCTQVNPEGFLKLPFSQRERLQQQIRQLAQQAQARLALTALQQELESQAATAESGSHKPAAPRSSSAESTSQRSSAPEGTDEDDTDEDDTDEDNTHEDDTHEDDTHGSKPEQEPATQDPIVAAPDLNEPDLNESNSSEPDSEESSQSAFALFVVDGDEAAKLLGAARDLAQTAADQSTETDRDQPETSTSPAIAQQELLAAIASQGLEGLAALGDRLMRLDPPAPPPPLQDIREPAVLMQWITSLEQATSQVLRRSSQLLTRTLETFHILNNTLPQVAPDQVQRAEAQERQPKDFPHIMSLVLEPAGKDASESPRLEIMTVYLRLSELEFSHPTLLAWRNQLRTGHQKLGQLDKTYRKKRQAKAVAEAEAAWRSSWHLG